MRFQKQLEAEVSSPVKEVIWAAKKAIFDARSGERERL